MTVIGLVVSIVSFVLSDHDWFFLRLVRSRLVIVNIGIIDDMWRMTRSIASDDDSRWQTYWIVGNSSFELNPRMKWQSVPKKARIIADFINCDTLPSWLSRHPVVSVTVIFSAMSLDTVITFTLRLLSWQIALASGECHSLSDDADVIGLRWFASRSQGRLHHMSSVSPSLLSGRRLLGPLRPPAGFLRPPQLRWLSRVLLPLLQLLHLPLGLTQNKMSIFGPEVRHYACPTV